MSVVVHRDLIHLSYHQCLVQFPAYNRHSVSACGENTQRGRQGLASGWKGMQVKERQEAGDPLKASL